MHRARSVYMRLPESGSPCCFARSTDLLPAAFRQSLGVRRCPNGRGAADRGRLRRERIAYAREKGDMLDCNPGRSSGQRANQPQGHRNYGFSTHAW